MAGKISGREVIRNTSAKLVELRGQRTQAEAANGIGISVSALSMYENGQRTPRDETKRRIARYYGETVQAIFFADENHKL